MYVCLCKGVTDGQIREAIDAGAQSMREIRHSLGVATGCGKCACSAREVIKDALESPENSTLFFHVA